MSLDFRSPRSPDQAALWTRRSAVKAGALGLMGGFGLDQLASLQAAQPSPGKAKSVIFIFLSGGLSQLESFDMKPDAPSDIRGEFNPIPTRTPGLHICEHLPELAKRSEKWAICRSLTHSCNEHSDGHLIMMTGRSDMPPGFDRTKPKESDWPSIAALTGTLIPPKGALPSAVVLPEKMVHRTGRVIPGQFAGLLGKHHDPFFLESSKYHPGSYGAYPDYLFDHPTGLVKRDDLEFRTFSLDLPDTVDFDRLNDRLGLRQFLDRQQAHLEKATEAQGLDRYREMAIGLLSDDKTKSAFDVHSVEDRVQDRYGRNAFGWSLLMARQLVEAGVRLVQVNLGNNETWDTHQAAFPNLREYLFPPTDRAVSALLDDLSERGMLDETLVVMASEFGRTPKVSTLRGVKLPGRDHWGAVQTVWLAGGGVTGGAVLGSTDKFGGHPASDARKPEDFAATIFDALGLPPSTYWQDVIGRPMPLYHGSPMRELFG
ncbi:MAG: DUF1501 domain-containing protein [Verrucomicrobiae bacterium]|nr:DUF1501 domain-containing protein [Verrucomicrobiae bacterium]